MSRIAIAAEIADYMVDAGTSHTLSGNYHFSFTEINRDFGTELPEDEEMMSMICKRIESEHCEKVAELDLTEDFDFMFWLDCCPYAEED